MQTLFLTVYHIKTCLRNSKELELEMLTKEIRIMLQIPSLARIQYQAIRIYDLNTSLELISTIKMPHLKRKGTVTKAA